jgi:hypothetical protein
MRMTDGLAALSLFCGACLAAAPAFAQQQSQSNNSSSQQQSQDVSSQDQTGDSVADAARKAREQQKTAPKPKKVYTDDDVKPATPPPSPAPAAKTASGDSQGASAEGDASKAADAGSSKEDSETMWRKKFADQRDKIAAAEKELDILQQEEQKAEVQYYPDPQKALQEQYTRQDINDKLAKIDAKKKEITDLKQQLDDMEDDLRKAGGDPGWAREP